MAAQEQVATVVANRHFEDVARLLDTMELESSNPLVLAEWPHAFHLLGHIYNKNLVDARFLWKRIPEAVKQNNPELEAVWKVLQYFWQRHYQGVWQALTAYQWSPQLQPFIEAIAVKTREELMELISVAYSTVRPSKVASICGINEQEALAACQAQGWRYDAATGVVHVVAKPAAAQQQDGFEQLQSLTAYMVHLEH